MRYYTGLFRILAFVSLLTITAKDNFAQEKSSYDMKFVHAMQFDKHDDNHILTVFEVTPTVNDFKLILSMRVIYEIGQGEKIVDVQKQKEDNIRIVIYGKTLPEKNPTLYNQIKDKINLDDEVRLITFDFYDITTEPVDRMSITYGLWESHDSDIRTEKRYDFNVEQMK